MTVANAVKKLEKAGFVVTSNMKGFHSGRRGANVIRFCENCGPDSITCINVRRVGDEDAPEQDYFAGVYCNNISQAIRLAD